jgi:hypothetical protein
VVLPVVLKDTTAEVLLAQAQHGERVLAAAALVVLELASRALGLSKVVLVVLD